MNKSLYCTLISALIFAACASSQQKGATDPSSTGGADNGAQAGALSSDQLEEIQRIVRNGLNGVNGCYTEEMERSNNKKLTGKIMVKILIDVTGKASAVEIMETNITTPAFQDCVKSTIKTWEFPRLQKPTEFTYPFEFSPAY